jgi:kynurenine formamidase
LAKLPPQLAHAGDSDPKRALGTDAGQAATFDPPFPNHYLMHGSGKFGLASLSNLDQLPPTGAVVIAAPLKIVGGSGSPLRVIAITPP